VLGQAKLSTTSREGRVLVLKIAEAGEVLGLSAVIVRDGRTVPGKLRGA
jgi:hypothetical protein